MARKELDAKTDEALMEAWQEGDRDAADVLITRHHPAVRRFFVTKVSEPDELVQRTFEAFVKDKDRYRGEASVRTFLLGIAKNLLRKHYRSMAGPRGKVDLGTVSAEQLQPSPSRALAERDEHRLLIRARRRLSVDQQVMLELHVDQGLKYREIAQIYDLPLGTLKTRMAAARKRLRELIEELADSPGLLQDTLTGLQLWQQGAPGDDPDEDPDRS